MKYGLSWRNTRFRRRLRCRQSLAEYYDFETSDGFVTDYDFVVRFIERRFVKGVMAHGGDRSLTEPTGIA